MLPTFPLFSRGNTRGSNKASTHSKLSIKTLLIKDGGLGGEIIFKPSVPPLINFEP